MSKRALFAASIIVGMMTFTGSVVAVLKLTDAWVKTHHKKTGVEVRKRHFLYCPLLYRNDHFTKTGSGQT